MRVHSYLQRNFALPDYLKIGVVRPATVARLWYHRYYTLRTGLEAQLHQHLSHAQSLLPRKYLSLYRKHQRMCLFSACKYETGIYHGHATVECHNSYSGKVKCKTMKQKPKHMLMF